MGIFGSILQLVVNIFCPQDKQQQQQQQSAPQTQHQQHQYQQPQPQPYQQSHQAPHRPQNQWTEAPHKPHHQQQQQQQHYPPQQQHSTSPRPHKQHVDLNQVNQHDDHYMALRRQANEEGDKMARCFDESQAAYKRGDGGQAKQLSNEGKTHKANMERLNKEASDWIYVKNNEDSGPGEIDLHGLYVREAIERTEAAIAAARQRGDGEVHLIVGQGLHSPGGAAKIKPAIADLIHRENLAAELDPHNAGVLVVRLDGKGGMGSDEITRRLERKDEGCFIM